jgi:hypothetical protein
MITREICSRNRKPLTDTMPTTLDVEKQRFVFGDSWTVAFKYDDCDFYRKGPERLKGELLERSEANGVAVEKVVPQSTRAVDVMAYCGEAGLLLMEAKDFRGYRIANKHRFKDSEVALEVALKARDTIAALVGALRQPESNFPADALRNTLEKNERVKLVLWLEDDALVDVKRAQQHLNTLNQTLKTKVAWLNVRTYVLSSRVRNWLPDLTVTNLPGAGQPNP